MAHSKKWQQEDIYNTIDALEKEAKKLGIDPDELDIRPDNFMEDPSTGKIKMTDV